METSELTIARQQWFEGDSFEAGRLLFERIPPGKRADWACHLLQMAVRAVGASNPLYDQLIGIQPAEWINAKDHFDRIRNQTLALESNSFSWCPPSLDLILSCIAENVAKVVYNECAADDEFDEESGWQLVCCLAGLADCSGIPELRHAFWEQLSCGGGERGGPG